MTELTIDTEKDFLELAHSLGKPIPSRLQSAIIDDLVPLLKDAANKQSLSANFGVDTFPYHTDGAYFKIPPRFIILRFVQGISEPTPTHLCELTNLDESQRKRLQYDVWKVRSRTSTFFSSILSEDGSFFRYDKCVMAPVSKKSDNSSFLEEIVSSQKKVVINWHLHKTIVIDNWTCLHARPKVKQEEINFRKLQRIMVL